MTSTLQPPRAPQTPRTRRSSGPARRAGRPRRPRRVAIVVGLLVGALVMLVVAALGEVTGKRVPLLSALAEAPNGDDPRLIEPRPPPPATPGSCLSWRRPDAADAEDVDCATPHLFEQAGSVQLADITSATLPDNQRFRQLVNERCTPIVLAYLDGKYDPYGAFRAGALKPSPKHWTDGDRSLRCGLQRFSRSGVLYPITGKVATQDQADIRPPGTCLGVDGRFIGDPVDCAQPHAVESVGAIDLGEKFKSKFPAVGEQDDFLQPACSKLAADYAGGEKNIADKKLSVLWDNLAQESWNGGTRKVACNLAAQLPDRSGFAPVTGSVKGPVQVGDRPAPPARPSAAPGAPARQAPSEPGPPLDSVPEPEIIDSGPPPETEEPLPPPPPPPARPSENPAPFKLPDDPLPDEPLPKDQLPRDQLPKDGLLPGRDGKPTVPTNPLGR